MGIVGFPSMIDGGIRGIAIWTSAATSREKFFVWFWLVNSPSFGDGVNFLLWWFV
jgi:uncharacterized membrane-anchored protein YitT (DUF2179 family)